MGNDLSRPGGHQGHCGTIILLPALSDSHQDVVSVWPGGKETPHRVLLLSLSLQDFALR